MELLGSIDSGNIYIEGDNLDALKLLQETYLGKVKTDIH
jgi:adenine-specific DNA-methyltransferase